MRLVLPLAALALLAMPSASAAELPGLPLGEARALAGAVAGGAAAVTVGAAHGAATAGALTTDLLGRALHASIGVVSALAAGLVTLAASFAAALVASVLALALALGAALSGIPGFVASHPELRRPEFLAGVGGTTGLLATAAYLAKRLLPLAGPLVPAYTRASDHEVLESPVRARMYEYIRANPGVHVSGLSTALALGWGTTVYHLSRLERAHLVSSRVGSRQRCFFENGGTYSPKEQVERAMLKNEKARGIVEFLRETPGASQKQVADALGMSQALVSWHVKRLEAAGVVQRGRSGRAASLTAAC
ncbi:MAG: winged helix-turn-helix transcriptional regulator [Methanobacteriota archaeon]